MTGTYLTSAERDTVTAAMDRLIPADDRSPGAGEAGGADYVDQLLSAFDWDPPRIWAGDPNAGLEQIWLELGASEELAWRIRIEGTEGRPEREFNGPRLGWRQQYRAGLARLGDDFPAADPEEQDRRLAGDPEFRDLLFRHGTEALYGDPVHGGNRDRAGWIAIGFDGPTQPRGWTDAEVSFPTGAAGNRS